MILQHNISFNLNSISTWTEVPPVAFNLHKVQRTRKCKCSDRFWYNDRWGDTCLVHICFPFRVFQGSILTGCSALFIHYTSLKPYLIRKYEEILNWVEICKTREHAKITPQIQRFSLLRKIGGRGLLDIITHLQLLHCCSWLLGDILWSFEEQQQ